MSTKGSSSPDITEEPNVGNTHEEINEEAIEGNTDGEGSNGGNNQEDTRGELNQGSTNDINEEDTEVEKLTATKDNARKIFDQLKEDDVSKIILLGETGTGKTWMASKICEVAVEKKYDEPIWICLDKKHDKKSFLDTVARRFSLPTSADEREEDGEKEKKDKKVNNAKRVAETMIGKLDAVKKKGKFILLVLDGQLEMMEKDQNEEMGIECYIKEEILGLKDSMNNIDSLKVLITRRKSEKGDNAVKAKKFKLEPFSEFETLELLKYKVDVNVCPEEFQKVSERCGRKPAEILMLAGTINYIAKDKSWELKAALEAAANGLEQLLRFAYDKERGNSMIDCFWHSWNFLGKHGGVHFNELITSWIMEGCLKHTNQIDKAYLEGHDVLMKLIEYHMLKLQEDNIVVVEGATREMNKFCRRGYLGTADPGLASVLKDIDETDLEEIPPAQVLEGITPADGMMRTLCGDKKEKMVSSLLIDGSRLCREVHDAFFGAKENLSLLAIFSPRLKSPEELSISRPEKLLVLMLRGSYLLENVNIVEKLKALTVLEISGSRAWTIKLSDNFFHEVSRLRSLDLTGAGFESLPDSFSELTELRRLILRQCSSLTQLPKLAKFSKLEVIDLSECTSLKKIQEKSFGKLEKLKVINFSHTKIEKLPIVKTLRNLTILLLKGCSELSAMRMLKQVSSLKILDLSGATNIKEIRYDCFEETENLRELDLSETQIQYLPPEIGDLQKLRLKGCKLLRNLPELSGHSRLEELELSGCERLENLPELSALQKLKILNLIGCSNLKSLPDLTSLLKLEKLDLQGTELWSEDVVKSLSHIKDLQILPRKVSTLPPS
ncbi:putative disease resistance protein At4g19050 [Gossypium arboreum]|uniref:putative disease resistance protein At4g19050 n=1 Tax=Gossypium arboreum TaxID=29729 RepID=UPI0008193FC5|nr:putative disease resistance protein At4g19050 [Gossypium arboreum]